MTALGLIRRGTILKYNGDGTVTIRVDGTTTINSDENTHSLSFPTGFVSQSGAFVGGYPEQGTPVSVEQGHGSWYISNYLKPDNLFKNVNKSNAGSIDSNPMGDYQPGRLLFQSPEATSRLYLDVNGEIGFGNALSGHVVDSRNGFTANVVPTIGNFTNASRSLSGVIKRDLQLSAINGLDDNLLSSTSYEDNLWTVGMDPKSTTSFITTSSFVRNLPLSEERKIVYEFVEQNINLTHEADSEELQKYNKTFVVKEKNYISKNELRTTSFSLNLYNPNHLIEEIVGTGVDTFGNVLDLNRAILPFGRKDLSFTNSEDKELAYKQIRSTHRKSLAYHFEINARKEVDSDGQSQFDKDKEIYSVLPITETKNYIRHRSTFFFDIDKEGQFKINVPASSETGNIPLNTRYVNASVLLYEDKQINNPNKSIIEEDGVDIFLENFGKKTGVALKGTEGTIGPIDIHSESNFKLNNVHHDILKAGYQFTKARITDDPNGYLVHYMPTSRINQEQNIIQYDKIVSNEIYINGPNANAGGRSGAFNLDGFISLNVGANTVDRQSMWIDTAGSIISTIGRDKRGISYCASLDGDMLVQIGGVGIGNDADQRFSNLNDAARSGALDIRVIKSDGQMTIVRIDERGVSIATPGRMEFSSEQDMIFKSNTNILMEAPNIGFYYESGGRYIKRTSEQELG